MSDGLLIVEASSLFRAIEGLDTGTAIQLSNGVWVTPAQLRGAAELLQKGPQPEANGIKSEMPGFIDRDAQKGKSLIFQVGILPSRQYRIDSIGRVREAA